MFEVRKDSFSFLTLRLRVKLRDKFILKRDNKKVKEMDTCVYL